ncbi:MAG: high-potential iron-sulfur protein [Lautropia sp.]
MSHRNRRVFVLQLAGAALAVGSVRTATAQSGAAPMVDPKDPLAASLGYVEDASKVDAGKFPQHKPDQSCAHCQLYTGKAGDKSGPCGIFAGKQVSASGWCVSFVKKA